MSMMPSFFGNNGRNSLDAWDPFKDSTFPSSMSNFYPNKETSTFGNSSSIRIDWKETHEAHVLKADLPGIKKEEVKVSIEDEWVLHISGEWKPEKEDKNDIWHRAERSSGMFQRKFRLPDNVKMDQIKASMDNGVLTIIVPKVVTKKAEVKSINIF
ncbi:hypothetical protein ACFE04_011956 [Oxalis oulophora]